MLKIIVANVTKILMSQYGFWDKMRILKTLSSLFLQSKVRFKHSSEVTHKIFEFNVTAYDYDTLKYLFKEIFISKEYHFESKNLSPSIIDCGANIGMSVLYFKHLYPNCKIIAFEPNPYAFTLLEKNVLQNSLKDVELRNIGLSSVEESIQFFLGENKGGLSGSIIQERGGENAINVQTAKLSTFIQDDTFDLIKMDVEGAETEIIKDLLLEKKINNSNRYMIEYHHRINNKKSSLSAFIKAFEDAGFEYNIRTDYLQLKEFQDILLNFYRDIESTTS